MPVREKYQLHSLLCIPSVAYVTAVRIAPGVIALPEMKNSHGAPIYSFYKINAMQKINTKLFTAMCIAGAYTAQAQTETVDSVKIKQQRLEPVEVRALRVGSNAPFAKTELNKAEIAKGNFGQDIPYLLQYTPSAVVTSDAGTGVGYTGLRIRGTDGVRMNVTMNGIPVNDAESQGVFFVNFPDIASSTGSIQLQRGVGTSTNGPAAFGATMSISNLEQQDSAGVEMRSGYGSFNTIRNTLKAGTGLLKSGLRFDVRLSQINSEGYVQRSASDLRSAQFIAGWEATPKTSMRFMLLTGKEKTGQAWNGLPGDSLKTNRTFNELGLKSDGTYYDNQTDNYQQDYYQYFLDHKFSRYLTGHIALFLTKGRGYYEEYRLGEDFSDYGLPNFDTLTSTDLVRQLWLDNYYYGSVFSLMYEKDKTQLTFGGGWNQYQGKHYGFVKWAQYGVPNDYKWYDLDAQKNDLNAYVKAQHTVGEKLILFGDLQLRNVTYDINGFRKNPTLNPKAEYTFLNPKVGVTYLLRNAWNQKQKVYASLAVGNKEPNRDDFEASPVSQPLPERLYDLEAGYEVNKKKWSFGANYYYMMYRDQLVFTGRINDVGAYTRTNVPESYRTGIELQASVVPAWWLRVNANATFSQNRVQNFSEYIDNYDDPSGYAQMEIKHNNTPLALSPAAIAGGGITIAPFRYMNHGQVLEMDILGKYVSKQYLDNSGDERRTLDAYGLCDLRFRYSVKFRPFRELGISLALNNILDHNYSSNGYVYYVYQMAGERIVDNRYFPQAGFNWLLGATLRF